jgi:hypothetical protein
MGLYDTYGDDQEIQLKVGNPDMHHYKVGDIVEIPDGVYVGWEGVVIISGSKLVASSSKIFNKWGGELNKEDLIKNDSEVHQVIKALKQQDSEVQQAAQALHISASLPKFHNPVKQPLLDEIPSEINMPYGLLPLDYNIAKKIAEAIHSKLDGVGVKIKNASLDVGSVSENVVGLCFEVQITARSLEPFRLKKQQLVVKLRNIRPVNGTD